MHVFGWERLTCGMDRRLKGPGSIYASQPKPPCPLIFIRNIATQARPTSRSR